MHYWVRASPADFSGTLPQPRSGHSAVSIGKSKVVFFGGLLDKTFLSDIAVYDTENKLWYQPECTGSGSNGQVGPNARAFHIAVAIDCHMFIFGGRYGSQRLGDFWVLDTDIWQWSELTSFGDLPSPRDFAAASSIGNRKIVMYGGWDGKKWMSDIYVLDTSNFANLAVSGSLPPPRCGHTATMVEKRMLIYGGRGGGGPIMSDLWALKGLIENIYGISCLSIVDMFKDFRHVGNPFFHTEREENETPGWTQLKLPGQAPTPRCGHTVTSGGHYLLLFGGHGTGGWLSRYDIYYNDCIVLDRLSAQWKRLPIGNEPPPARAYHSLTCIGSTYLLFGGFDGKVTYGDLWWLVPEEDPMVKKLVASSPNNVIENKDVVSETPSVQYGLKDTHNKTSALSELQSKFGISVSLTGSGSPVLDVVADREFLDLAFSLTKERVSINEVNSQSQAIQALRQHWGKSTTNSIAIKELRPLLRDYQRLITSIYLSDLQYTNNSLLGKDAYRFYHLKDVNQLRIDDIPELLAEYRQLIPELKTVKIVSSLF